MIRIHFTYRHVDKPWGGANNFIRALHGHMTASGGFEFTATPQEPCDILFMNQLNKGPGSNGAKPWTPGEVSALLSSHARRPKLVVRAVNLNSHAFPMGPRNFLFGRPEDKRTVRLLNMADFVIFQSEYQRGFFVDAGFRGSRYAVIHNGAGPRFWVANRLVPGGESLRLVSSTASPRKTKCHFLIAAISRIAGVEVRHLGAWPDDVDPQAVRRMGVLPAEQMVPVFADSHYMLHPAIKDPCPNSIFDAICAGLPVIYNPGPGSSAEIVRECGFALDAGHLDRTIDEARQRLSALSAEVLRRRGEYSIDRAAGKYREVFLDVAEPVR